VIQPAVIRTFMGGDVWNRTTRNVNGVIGVKVDTEDSNGESEM
jgi:hypothetical protein